MKRTSLCIALSLVAVSLVAPVALADEQRTDVRIEADDDGATANVSTEGALADESVVLVVPPEDAAPAEDRTEQRVDVSVDGNESGATAVVSADGDLADEEVVVSVPPEVPSPPSPPSVPDLPCFRVGTYICVT